MLGYGLWKGARVKILKDDSNASWALRGMVLVEFIDPTKEFSPTGEPITRTWIYAQNLRHRSSKMPPLLANGGRVRLIERSQRPSRVRLKVHEEE